MSGALVGEVARNQKGLKAAGVSRPAVLLLKDLAEALRADRVGEASLAYLAIATDTSERSVSRHLAELIEVGLLVVVRRGGGRGHTGVQALYRMADLRTWLTERGATWMATHSEAIRAYGRHRSGESIRSRGESIDPPAELTRHLGGDSIGVDGGPIPDPVAISDRLTRHLGGDHPVVPVKDPGETPEVTTGPRATEPPPAPAPADPAPPTMPSSPAPAPAVPAAGMAPTGSLCGQPSCRHPAPCRACGVVRAERAAAQDQAELDAAAAARRSREERERQALEADRAACPKMCTAGMWHDPARGRVACDHRPMTREDAKVFARRYLKPGRPSTRIGRRYRAPYLARRGAATHPDTTAADAREDLTGVPTEPYGIPTVPTPDRAAS